MAIVSARGGMTNQLVAVVNSALEGIMQVETALDWALVGKLSILNELARGDMIWSHSPPALTPAPQPSYEDGCGKWHI